MAAGFVDFEILWRGDVYSDTPQSSSASEFGTVGITFRARRARDEPEWLAAIEALSCAVEMPAPQALGDRPTAARPRRTAP